MSLKIATIAAALTGAAAFAPSTGMQNVAKSSSALKMGFEKEIGAQPPLGFWDPLKILEGESAERFAELREYEVKHGRVAQLAVLGHILTTAGARWPGTYDLAGHTWSSVPTGLKAFSTLPAGGLAQIFLFIGVMEMGYSVRKDEIAANCEERMTKAGWSDAKKDSKRAIELNNGRAAMMGIWGLVTHELIDGNPYVLNSLLGAPVDFNAGF